jgi:hypothetical protein
LTERTGAGMIPCFLEKIIILPRAIRVFLNP